MRLNVLFLDKKKTLRQWSSSSALELERWDFDTNNLKTPHNKSTQHGNHLKKVLNDFYVLLL